MIWLLLAFAIHPGIVDVAGMAGSTSTVDLLVASDEKLRLEATPPLEYSENVQAGVENMQATLRIDPNAAPGIYESYLYAIPESDERIVRGQAVKVRTTVEGRKSASHIIAGTQKGISLWAYGVAAAIGVLGVLAAAVRIKRA